MLTLDETKEIYWNCLSLVNELEERVLTVRSWFSKVNFTNWIINFNTVFVNSLSV